MFHFNILLKKNYRILFLMFLWYTKCFTFVYFPFGNTMYGWLSHLLSIFLILYIFFNREVFKGKNLHFTRAVICLMLVPFLSIISTVICNNQPLIKSLAALSFLFTFLWYFILHKWRLTAKHLGDFVIVTGVIYSCIMLIQQITYPFLLFRIMDFQEFTGQMEMRMGFWRIMIEGRVWAQFAGILAFEKLIRRVNTKHILLCILISAGIFLTMSRMIWATYALGVLVIYFSTGKRSMFLKIATLAIGLYLFISSISDAFTEMQQMTLEHLENEDYVRWIAYDYFMWGNWHGELTVAFGNGLPIGGAKYGEHIFEYEELYGLYRSDIGLVGNLTDWGIAYLLAFIYFCVIIIKKSLKCRNKAYLAFIISQVVLCLIYPMIPRGSFILLWVIVLFMVDKDLESQGIRAKR